MSASAKGKQKKVGSTAAVSGTVCIGHNPYYLSELSRANFSDNLSRNSCIL